MSGRLAFLVAAGILLSRIVGLVRLNVFSHYFGLRSDAADASRLRANETSAKDAMRLLRSPPSNLGCTLRSIGTFAACIERIAVDKSPFHH